MGIIDFIKMQKNKNKINSNYSEMVRLSKDPAKLVNDEKMMKKFDDLYDDTLHAFDDSSSIVNDKIDSTTAQIDKQIAEADKKIEQASKYSYKFDPSKAFSNEEAIPYTILIIIAKIFEYIFHCYYIISL